MKLLQSKSTFSSDNFRGIENEKFHQSCISIRRELVPSAKVEGAFTCKLYLSRNQFSSSEFVGWELECHISGCKICLIAIFYVETCGNWFLGSPTTSDRHGGGFTHILIQFLLSNVRRQQQQHWTGWEFEMPQFRRRSLFVVVAACSLVTPEKGNRVQRSRYHHVVVVVVVVADTMRRNVSKEKCKSSRQLAPNREQPTTCCRTWLGSVGRVVR